MIETRSKLNIYTHLHTQNTQKKPTIFNSTKYYINIEKKSVRQKILISLLQNEFAHMNYLYIICTCHTECLSWDNIDTKKKKKKSKKKNAKRSILLIITK